MTVRRKRVAFFAEAVTLAHVARPLALGSGLDPEQYDVFFVCDSRYENFVADSGWNVRRINSISGDQFRDALAHGRPLYDVPTLRRYVHDDLAIIEDIRPDLLVGDFRLSLSVSARVAKIPYATITSAYWSPFARQPFPLAEHPLVDAIGPAAAQFAFDLVRPFVFAYHARPMNRVRREFGLPSLGPDLRRVYTDADLVLYADPPGLVPIEELPANHHYLGPVLWSPPVDRPEWWDTLRGDRPVVYVTMGSSGSGRLLDMALEALSEIDCYVIAATAGGALGRSAPSNAFVADYIPGSEAAQRASLVICNGGSPTSHQALAANVPVLGIAANMDQHLNMQGIERLGAGLRLRSDRATVDILSTSIRQLLGNPAYRIAAAALGETMRRYDARAAFSAIVDRALEATLLANGPRSAS